MSEVVKASTQYGDLKGSISCDGWDGVTTLSLGIGCPRGYWPVGFEICAEPDSRGGKIDPDIYVLAIDESILDGKPGPDAVRKYAEQNPRLPVFRFRSKAKLSKLLGSMKRLSIVLQDKGTRGAQLVLTGGDTIYGDEDEGENSDG